MNEKIKDLIRYEFMITVIVLACLLYHLWPTLSDSYFDAIPLPNLLGGSASLLLVPTVPLILLLFVLPLPSYHRNRCLAALSVIFYSLSFMIAIAKQGQPSIVCLVISGAFLIGFVLFRFIRKEKIERKGTWVITLCILGQLVFFWLVVSPLYLFF